MLRCRGWHVLVFVFRWPCLPHAGLQVEWYSTAVQAWEGTDDSFCIDIEIKT